MLTKSKHTCAVCEETFASRSKLFAHIEVSDHAAPVATSQGKKGTKKAKR